MRPGGRAVFMDVLAPPGMHPVQKLLYRQRSMYSKLHKAFSRREYLGLISAHFDIQRIGYLGSAGLGLIYLMDWTKLCRVLPARTGIVGLLAWIDAGLVKVTWRAAVNAFIVATPKPGRWQS